MRRNYTWIGFGGAVGRYPRVAFRCHGVAGDPNNSLWSFKGWQTAIVLSRFNDQGSGMIGLVKIAAEWDMLNITSGLLQIECLKKSVDDPGNSVAA